MTQKQEYNLKNHMIAFSVALSIILVSYIDKYVYDLRTLTGAILAGILTYGLSVFFEKLSFWDKDISKRTQRFLTILTLFLIFFSFYYFQL